MIKNIFSLTILVAAASLILGSCRKYSPVSNDQNVGISKITYYPIVTIKGEHLMILKQGDAYTDPGVDATIKDQPVTPVVSGSVNTAVPAVYNITYSATNEDGFSASDWRTVVVIGNDVAANDFSGTYLRAATGVTSTWTKTAPGVYNVDNPGGAAVGVGYIVIAVNYTGNKIAIPKQYATDPTVGSPGIVSSSKETYTPAQYSWVFLAGGYGTGLRTFDKQ
ncbi:immunoglobulin-like domain-containing protein [Pinibacter aurantiacus]|uniref:DUF5011 domain-containing protein n=1 Tax=Pinibacter aurantiacus TaxID=2851599 RepID=A0A9E2S7T8_9BACT|nr:immunoglobulin-like domain-containing protein [Pinibacter aurantiacus]MBV4358178.1 DUF5011 domain-containing protein [Pinibacter aurantiacus]